MSRWWPASCVLATLAVILALAAIINSLGS
jgi:hypothetical protein